MNKNQLIKNLGHVVQLRPVPLRPNPSGDLPRIDDDWRIDRIDDAYVHLHNLGTGHTTLLSYDQIHSYMGNPNRNTDAQKYGFLQLRVQISLLPAGLNVEPLPPGNWGSDAPTNNSHKQGVPLLIEQQTAVPELDSCVGLNSERRMAERVFTRRSARELLAFYEGPGRTTLQGNKLMEPHIGLWVSVEGTVLQVLRTGPVIYTLVLEIEPAVRREGPVPSDCLVNAIFEKKWEQELSRLNTGDMIKIQGKIAGDQNGHQLYLGECEIHLS